MGMTPAKTFAPPQAIGQAGFPSDTLQQSQAATPLPNNPFLPMLQDAMPTVQTANAVPNAPAPNQAPFNPNQQQYGSAMKYPYGNRNMSGY